MQSKGKILASDVGLDGRKCSLVVEQDFHRNFRVKLTLRGFLPFPRVSLTEQCSFWYGLK